MAFDMGTGYNTSWGMKKSIKLDVRINIDDEGLEVLAQSSYSPEEDFVAKVKTAVEKLVRKHYLKDSP